MNASIVPRNSKRMFHVSTDQGMCHFVGFRDMLDLAYTQQFVQQAYLP